MKLGYATLSKADGIFGKKTEEAVKEFQERNGLKVDGIVDPKTWGSPELVSGDEAKSWKVERLKGRLKGCLPLAGLKVVIDPGHGLYWNGRRWAYQRARCDPESSSGENGKVICKADQRDVCLRQDKSDICAPGYVEDEGVMPVAYRLVKRLIRTGAKVYTTRAIDLKTGELDRRKSEFIPDKERWQEGALLYLYKIMGWSPKGGYPKDLRIRWRYENKVSSQLPADSCQLIYISIHTNAGGPRGINIPQGGGYGTETYTSGSRKSKKLAVFIHKRTLKTIRQKFPDWKEHGKNPRKKDFAVLKHTFCPAALIELGFHDSSDLKHILTDEWKEAAAQGMFDGIVEYFA